MNKSNRIIEDDETGDVSYSGKKKHHYHDRGSDDDLKRDPKRDRNKKQFKQFANEYAKNKWS